MRYPAAIPQCLDAASAAFSKRDIPTRETVGTIVNGVINFNKYPMIPISKIILKEDNVEERFNVQTII